MKKKKKKTTGQMLFDSIRKPVAPPTRKIGTDKPAEKARPSQRKIKHKKVEDLDTQP
jgi:hypothetical protein